MNIQVSPSLNIFDSLTYNYTGDPGLLKTGLRVVIPVGTRMVTGWVTDVQSEYKGRVKDIIAVVDDDYNHGDLFLEFARAVSDSYFTSIGTLLDSSMPPKKKGITNLYFDPGDGKGKPVKLNKYSIKELQKRSEGGAIRCFYKGCSGDPFASLEGVEAINDSCEILEAEPEASVKNTFLLSTKREGYYKNLIMKCLDEGKSVLIAAPDNLTAAYLRHFLEELEGIPVDVYNSELKPKERDALWKDYSQGKKAGVLIGGLSAVLLPVQNLGLVIVDRSGSFTYKRSFFSKYNIRFLAQLRARYFNIPLVQGFGVPTVHVYGQDSNVLIEDLRADEPKIPVDVRMIKRGTKGVPSDFVELVNYYFNEGKRILVVLNKKQGAGFLFCDKCKRIAVCPGCDGLLEVGEEFSVSCKRCGFERENFDCCPKCNQSLVYMEDISISSVKKVIKAQVMESGIMSISSEGLKDEHIYSILKRMEASRIVIGTPIVINPFFRDLFDTVIYLRPESYFKLEEFDAAEMVFSTVSELRELVGEGGNIHIFSTFHFHYSLKAINDEARFFEREMKYREWFNLPPFANVYHIEVKGKDLRKLAKDMRGIFAKHKNVLTIKRVFLLNRRPQRGVFKGILEVHAQPDDILKSGLLGKRHIEIDLVLV